MLTPDRKPFHIPTERGKVGRYCILPGAPERVEQIAALLEEPVFVGRNREFTVWNGKLAGETVTVCSTGIGGPSAAIAAVNWSIAARRCSSGSERAAESQRRLQAETLWWQPARCGRTALRMNTRRPNIPQSRISA